MKLGSGFRGRLVGIHAGRTEAILLHTRSVHGKGLAKPLRVVHVTRSGTVIGDEPLHVEGRVNARSYWILELPSSMNAPVEGCALRVLPSSSG